MMYKKPHSKKSRLSMFAAIAIALSLSLSACQSIDNNTVPTIATTTATTTTVSLTQMTTTTTPAPTLATTTTTTPAPETTTTTTVSETTTTASETTTAPTDSTDSETTTAETASDSGGAWNETKLDKTMITTQACYSRVDAIIGAQTVSEIPAGTVLRVVAVTDTGYYKLENGSFVHSDYLADSNATPTPTTTAAPVQTTPAPSDPTTPSANNVTGNVKYTKRYFWSQLTASEQTLYADIVKAAENFETGYIAAPAGMSTDDKKKIYFLVFNMEPQLFWIDTSVTTTGDSVRLSYTLTPNQAASMKTEIDATAAKVIKQANQYSSTFNKLLVFYNYIILNNDFLLESTSATCGIENGLRPGTSGIQCNGYAKTMQYLCDIAGIECLTIPGMNNNTPSSTHAWNKIKIGSSWYNMDATWGDPEDKGGKYISHPFFLVPDAWITNSHLASNTKTLNNGTTLYFFNAPACTATDMNYFKIMNREYTDLDTAFNAMAAELKRALEAGEMTAEIRVTDNAVYNTLLTDEYTLALRKYARQFVPGLEVKRQRANREKSQIYQLDLIY